MWSRVRFPHPAQTKGRRNDHLSSVRSCAVRRCAHELPTQEDAQTALNETLADRRRGTYASPSRTTVRDFLDEWHEGARTELALTASTNDGQIIRRNIDPYLSSKRLTTCRRWT